MSCSRLNTVAKVPETNNSTIVNKKNYLQSTPLSYYILPANTPQRTVDINGVLVVVLILAINLKRRPSLAIEYKIRGSGNKAPRRLNYEKIQIKLDYLDNNYVLSF